MIRPFPAIVGALALVLCAGCVISHSNSKAVYTLRRHLNAWETTVAVPIEKAHRATAAGLSDLGLKPVTSRVDKLSGLAAGSMADGTAFEVRLDAIDAAQTRIRVRSGLLGDRERSTQLFRAIEARL
jgi:hypothetical protein